MGIATFVIGLLPSYRTIGLGAPILFVGMRMLQGLALGGEYGGAVVYVAEHTANKQRGAKTAWIQATAALGLLLSLAVILPTRYLLGETEFSAWGCVVQRNSVKPESMYSNEGPIRVDGFIRGVLTKTCWSTPEEADASAFKQIDVIARILRSVNRRVLLYASMFAERRHHFIETVTFDERKQFAFSDKPHGASPCTLPRKP